MFLFAYLYKSEQEHSFSTYKLTSQEISLLKNGDILLRHGYGMVSDMIVTTLHEDYDISHCAVLVKDSNQFKLIHSVSQSLSDFDGVQSQSLNRFVSDSKENSLIVVRFKGDSNEIIAKRAKYYLSMKIPFDNDFDIKDTAKFYCTELIWKTIKDAYHIDIFADQMQEKDKKSHYKFNTLWDTTYFQIIINHHKKN